MPSGLRHVLLSCLLKLLILAPAETLTVVLKDLAVASHVAGMLSSADKVVIVAAIQVRSA